VSLLDALNDLTLVTSEVFKQTNTTPTCGNKCGACCFEPVYATRAEAQLIIDTIRALPNGETGVQMVRVTVAAWLLRFAVSDLYEQQKPAALEYRALFMACPFLQADQSCDVYAVRPSGCRMHFTIGHPSWCGNLEKRREQQYVDVAGTALKIPPLMDALMEIGRQVHAVDPAGTTDHLGVMLADVLGLDPRPSGARETPGEIVQDEA
jgi:Fe-S-cluster containining protein